MTNTRMTDPETLEVRYPVRLWRFQVRSGSGGAGAKRGGDGVIRELEFLAPLSVTTLNQRRGEYPPFGLRGGGPGAVGENIMIHGGQSKTVPGCTTMTVEVGDRLIVQTPGGGGYGAAETV
jgi:5-oxoprolinase (ATP-hydrolysing)